MRRCATSRCFRHHRRGFTLVELVVVMILLGVLSATAIPRMTGPDAFEPATFTHQLKMELRLAQSLAGSRQDADISLQVSAEPSGWRISTFSSIDGEVRRTDIDGGTLAIIATSGSATGDLTGGDDLQITYDGLGGLRSLLLGANVGDASDGLEISISGQSARTLCIYPSGYADEQPCA